MGNKQQNPHPSSQVQQTPPQQDKSLEWLLSTQPTIAEFVACRMDLNIAFSSKCPICHFDSFDDGLGRRINCYKCSAVYVVRDGLVEITSQEDLRIDERRHSSQLEGSLNYPDLTSLILYCNRLIHYKNRNRDNLPVELMANGEINFKILLQKVIVPFFSIRQRVVTQGVTFNIGQFEFKAVGSFPRLGKVSQQTEIYCYNSYSRTSVVKQLVVAPINALGNKPTNNNGSYFDGSGISTEIKSYFSQYDAQNTLIQDQHLRINQTDIIVIKVSPNGANGGRVTSETSIECCGNVLRSLKEIRVICLQLDEYDQIRKLPVGMNRDLLSNPTNLEKGILKTVIIPYYTGMTRYVETGQNIPTSVNGFEFRLEVPEGRGLVIPYKTQITLSLKVGNDGNGVGGNNRQEVQIRKQNEESIQSKGNVRVMQRSMKIKTQQPQAQMQSQMHCPQHHVRNNQPRRQRLSAVVRQQMEFEQQPQEEESTVVRSPDAMHVLQHILQSRGGGQRGNEQPSQRLGRSDHHLQQIEALHRLLNTFILLNEHSEMALLYKNQGASQGMISRLPERKIDLKFMKDRNLVDSDHVRCLICLVDYEQDETVRTMPCLHFFHIDCLDSWLVKNKTCPICKTSCDQEHQD